MSSSPKITKIEVATFEHELEKIGKDYNTFNMVYEPGNRLTQRGSVLQIHTDQGITGEYPGGVTGPALPQIRHVSEYLIGKDTLEREKIYQDLKRGLRQ